MHHKNIKHSIKKQLKNKFPKWKRLTKNTKKQIADDVLDEYVGKYDFSQQIEAIYVPVVDRLRTVLPRQPVHYSPIRVHFKPGTQQVV